QTPAMRPSLRSRSCSSPTAPCLAAFAANTPYSAASPREIQREEFGIMAGGAMPVAAARAVASAPAGCDALSFQARHATAAAPVPAAKRVGQIFFANTRGPSIPYPTRISVSYPASTALAKSFQVSKAPANAKYSAVGTTTEPGVVHDVR